MSKNNSKYSPSPIRNQKSKYQQAISSRRFTVDTASSSRSEPKRSDVDDLAKNKRKNETAKMRRRNSMLVDKHAKKKGAFTCRCSTLVDHTEDERNSATPSTFRFNISPLVDNHTDKERKAKSANTLNFRRSSFVDDPSDKQRKHETSSSLNRTRSSFVYDHTDQNRKLETTSTIIRRHSPFRKRRYTFVDNLPEEGSQHTNADIVIRVEVSKPKKRVRFLDEIVKSDRKSWNVDLVTSKAERIPKRRNTYVDDTDRNKRICMNTTPKPSRRNTFVDSIDENRAKSINNNDFKLIILKSHVDSNKDKRPDKKASQCLDSKSESPTCFRVPQIPKEKKQQLKTPTNSQKNEPANKIMTSVPLNINPMTWSGSISASGLFKMNIIMESIVGYCYQFNHLTDHNLNICCGVYQTAVWKCMSNLLKSRKKNISIVLIKPSNMCDVPAYNYWFYFFHTRGQVAHIAIRQINMSFFLVLPLAAGQRIDGSILKNFKVDPSSLEFVSKSNSLIGLMILKPNCDMSYITLKPQELPPPCGYGTQPNPLPVPEGILHNNPSTSKIN